MIHFRRLPIDKDFVSVFASGDSKKKLTSDEIKEIQKKTFTIGLNLFRMFPPDALLWSDWKLSRYYSETPPKARYLITRPGAFIKPNIQYSIRYKIDYWFDEKDEHFYDGNFTLWKLIQLLRKYFPDKKVLIFGMDCEEPYSESVDPFGVIIRTTNKNQARALGLENKNKSTLPGEMEKIKNSKPGYFDNIFNCNLESNVEVIQKRCFKAVLDEKNIQTL